MNKLKTLFPVVIVLGMLASCGIDDLEKRVDKIENGLGFKEPIKINFSTTNDDDETVNEKGPFAFAGAYNGYFYNYSDDMYYVYVERFTNLEYYQNSGPSAELEFEFDATTKEVTWSDLDLVFFLQNGHQLYPEFNSDAETLTLKINSFNPETGAINVSFSGNTSEESEDNVYEGKSMKVSGSFKGKLKYSYPG